MPHSCPVKRSPSRCCRCLRSACFCFAFALFTSAWPLSVWCCAVLPLHPTVDCRCCALSSTHLTSATTVLRDSHACLSIRRASPDPHRRTSQEGARIMADERAPVDEWRARPGPMAVVVGRCPVARWLLLCHAPVAMRRWLRGASGVRCVPTRAIAAGLRA